MEETMGDYLHHAIIVTANWAELQTLALAHRKALQLFSSGQVSTVGISPINGFESFCIFPDGSKIGREDSDKGDYARDQMVEWMERQDCLDWVEIQYGPAIRPLIKRSSYLEDE